MSPPAYLRRKQWPAQPRTDPTVEDINTGIRRRSVSASVAAAIRRRYEALELGLERSRQTVSKVLHERNSTALTAHPRPVLAASMCLTFGLPGILLQHSLRTFTASSTSPIMQCAKRK